MAAQTSWASETLAVTHTTSFEVEDATSAKAARTQSLQVWETLVVISRKCVPVAILALLGGAAAAGTQDVIPTLKGRLRVEPLVREQEFVSPIGVHKYEGASKVAGEIQGEPATGHAVVEVGDWN